LSDFIVAGILLFATVVVLELAVKKIPSLKGRLIVCSAVLIVLFLVWAELAVGIVGAPLAGTFTRCSIRFR
jgi:hypothetical protein